MAIKKHLPAILTTLLLLIFIAGCKVGPNYKRPGYPTGDQYRFSISGDTNSIADTSWTYVFRDTVLQQMIRQGLAYNFDLLMAVERINQARAVFKNVRADLWPSLSASGAAAWTKSQSPAG
ncbi:MAG: TolC family protein, partial [Bacteroidales bacterium]|nr:TolC family protein [Bacteroidales bacterium]